MSKDDQLPALPLNALSNLTQKIESKLKQHEKGSQSKRANAKPKGKNEKQGKRSQGNQVDRIAQVSNESNRSKQAVGKREPTSVPQLNQGKKRSRDGKVKDQRQQKNGDDANTTGLGSRESKTVMNGGINIPEDIQELGGTRDDMDLIANVPSDSEVEGDNVADSEIKTELQQLIRQLGVDSMDRREQMDDTVSEQEDDEKVKADVAQSRHDSIQQQTDNVEVRKSSRRLPGKGVASLAFEPRSEWHAAELPALPSPSREGASLPPDLLTRIQAYAQSLLDLENQEYTAHNPSASGAQQFYSTIMSTGTLSDKVSALTLSIQESPVHNLRALDSLVGMARKRSRGQAVEVLGALKDLFGPGNLLPSDRKLRHFANQPALSGVFDPVDFQWTSKNPLPKHLKPSHLISWAFEDRLKAVYFEVLKIVENWCNDEVLFSRSKAVDYIFQLLKEKPEQEANLLRLLVNKLGDSDKKIASKTSFHLLQLETTHPLMKPTVISAIESDILFRSGQSLHAKYYATITLNQTVLSGKEEGVAKKLLEIYFSLFLQLLEKPQGAKSTSQPKESDINRKGDVQGGGGVRGRKALKKLARSEKATTVEEELREKMLSAVLTGINRAIPFTNTNDESFEKHLDTLFRVTHSSNFNTSIQALMLIQQLNGSNQRSVDRSYRTLYESLLDSRLLTSSKQALYLNLLFRALRSDLNIKRVKAFSKRLLQVVAMHQPSFTCGTLYLLRELEGVFANLAAFIDEPGEDSDDEEVFKDVPENVTDGDIPQEDQQTSNAVASSKPLKSLKYDGRKRDPEFSNADHSSLWELTPFLHHYHPSVSLFATRLLTHSPMPPKPDLSLNTLIHFLDRFVYRNPKTTTAPKGSSIMQPMAGGDSSALLVSAYSGKDRRRQPVNSAAFWKQESEKVGADEVFFHRYFSTLGKGREKALKKKQKKKDRKKDGGGSENESDADEDEVWKALVDSRPELEGGSDGGVFSDGDDDDIGSDLQDLEDENSSAAHDSNADGDAFSSIGLEDEDALLDSEAEVPTSEQQAKQGERESRGSKRRRLKNLPTFASVEDYAEMLDGDEDADGDE